MQTPTEQVIPVNMRIRLMKLICWCEGIEVVANRNIHYKYDNGKRLIEKPEHCEYLQLKLRKSINSPRPASDQNRGSVVTMDVMMIIKDTNNPRKQ